MKIKALALIATATAQHPSPCRQPPTPTLSTNTFWHRRETSTAPSCCSRNNDVQCGLVEHTCQPPQACSTASEVVGVSMRADSTAAAPVVGCEKYPNQLPLPWPTLNYGQTRSLGERIYLASDEARHESCDALQQFAQAAVPRIGA
jgi:hypothetical protein